MLNKELIIHPYKKTNKKSNLKRKLLQENLQGVTYPQIKSVFKTQMTKLIRLSNRSISLNSYKSLRESNSYLAVLKHHWEAQ